MNMLRHKLGDETFWKGIRTYYKTYQNSNAMTADFQKVMEKVSRENLEWFFNQWIFTEGHPEIKWYWSYKKGIVKIIIEQQQDPIFQFPLEIGFVVDGKTMLKTIEIDEQSITVEIEAASRPEKVTLDPNLWLLFEERS